MARRVKLRAPHAKVGVLAVVLLLLFPPAFVDTRYSVLEAALALLAVALLPSVATRRVIALPTALALLTGLMGLSSIWSAASWVTLTDAVSYAVLVVAAVLLVRSLSLGQVATAIVIMGFSALLLSVAVSIARPDIALDSWGLLQGIYANRNGLGYVLVQTIPALIALPLRFRFSMVARLLFLGVFCWGIVATGSKTALITAALVVLAWAGMLIVRRWRFTAWVLGGLTALAGAAVVVNREFLLELLGKDSTASGRTEIWGALVPVMADHPVLGIGWSKSWPPGSAAYEAMVDAFGRPFFHAHSEAFNWFVTLGAVGLILVIALYGFTAWAGWKLWVDDGPGASFVLLALVMTVSRGLTEISETSAQGWLVLALAAAAGAQHLVNARQRLPALVLLQWPHTPNSPQNQAAGAPIAM